MEDFATSGATKAPVARRLEVLSGAERRRRYSEEKTALVAETFRPDVCTADLARRHGLHPQQLYTWRCRARRGELVLRDEDLPMFAPFQSGEVDYSGRVSRHGNARMRGLLFEAATALIVSAFPTPFCR